MIDVDFKKTIVLDFESRSAQVNGKNINLTSSEFRLICIFYKKRGTVLTRSEIGNLLHGRDIDLFNRSIDVIVSRLRQKLNVHFEEQTIKSIRGRGYTINAKIESSFKQSKNEFKGILELTNPIGLSR